MTDEVWPPVFTLDQERILDLLTGDRFYSNPSAALREAVLNAIDAVQRRQKGTSNHAADISVTFNTNDLTIAIMDNGVGMDRGDIASLFTKVGASAANAEAEKKSVGEFGIGVISYFMAADFFELQTRAASSDPVGLAFSRTMLAGGSAGAVQPSRESQGTTVTLRVRDQQTFKLLLDSYAHWCRDVEGLKAIVMPEDRALPQGRPHRPADVVELQNPEWIERSHLSPVADPSGWDAMTGMSTVAVLYRGVFVQEFQVRGAWGIEGSIDVDPKYFKPRLNREGFVEGAFQSEVEGFLRRCHPAILHAMAARLSEAVRTHSLDKWTEKRWASLWLSVPRSAEYAHAVAAWDAVFRTIPAFELAVGNNWEAISLERIKAIRGDVYLAPLADEKSNDVVKAALHFLRTTGRSVVRGIRKDNSWMRFAPAVFGTTADLISTVFSRELPPLVSLTANADQVLGGIQQSAPLFTGPPFVDLVRLGAESPPALRLKSRLVINIDNPKGAAIARGALKENRGPAVLYELVAQNAYEQLTEVAAALREMRTEPEILSPVRRRFIRQSLS